MPKSTIKQITKNIATARADTPLCIGLIPDGNRRWAKHRGLPTYRGHYKCYKRIKEIAQWARDAGIHYLIIYAFSTENWKRAPREVDYLMRLFKRAAEKDGAEFVKQKIALRIIGEREKLPSGLAEKLAELEQSTHSKNPECTLALAISYGGRQEILNAVNRIITKRGATNTIKPVQEPEFTAMLYTAGIPDPDLVIRTGGEKRISGFLLWQIAYSELFFSDTLFPDFSREEFTAILNEFAARQRRFGA